jgi:hypothetical protein
LEKYKLFFNKGCYHSFSKFLAPQLLYFLAGQRIEMGAVLLHKQHAIISIFIFVRPSVEQVAYDMRKFGFLYRIFSGVVYFLL